MTLSQADIQAISANLASRLDTAGIAYTTLRILPPGTPVAPEWDYVFDTQYTGWRISIDGTLTAGQQAAIAAAALNLEVKDYLAEVLAEVLASFAALPKLMRTGTYEEIEAYYASVPHATDAAWKARQETFLLFLVRGWVINRDWDRAQYRAAQLREDAG